MPQPQPQGNLPIRTAWMEWNALVPLAEARGIRRIQRLDQCWRISRAEANRRVDWLRAQIAPFALPEVSIETGVQTFGVEFEVILPPGLSKAGLAAKITEAGLNCTAEMYNHRTVGYWKVVPDGSLNSRSGAELVSPILSGEEGFQAMRVACRVLLEQGCRVTKHCGLHVHVGARGRSLDWVKNMLTIYRHYEPAIDSFMAPSRRSALNVYCQPVRFNADTLERARTIDDLQSDRLLEQRYRKLNLSSYWRHGTLEFRHHQGTIEGSKAEMWVRLCLRIAARAGSHFDPAVNGSDLSAMLACVQADDNERTYFTERATHFARLVERRFERRAA